MTLYEQFKKAKLDLTLLGLENGPARSDYFCTPIGAKVIGWAGVDGIHFCFIRGFDDMVFSGIMCIQWLEALLIFCVCYWLAEIQQL